MTVLLLVSAKMGLFLLMFFIGQWIFRPLGWWLFKLAHRNNPDALEFANRKGN